MFVIKRRDIPQPPAVPLEGTFADDLAKNRDYARLAAPLAGLRGSPSDQAVVGFSHLLRAILPDAMIVYSTRAVETGSSVVSALLLGALVDLTEAAPCFVLGVLNVGVAGARATRL
ncbi:MAG: hypothetical protein ACAI38_13210 [Myxococcota bacterium]|nr:hypothetical protein [Myxococcota bacterium]